MKILPKFVMMILLTGIFFVSADGQQFRSVNEAIDALKNSDYKVSDAARNYLAETPKKSVPVLKNIIEEKKENWIWAMSALNEISKENAVTLYIKLLEKNFYLKEKDGTRKKFGLGTKNGCLVQENIYGGMLVMNLAWLEDKRAIPVLQKSLKQGDSKVRGYAFYALYKLDDITLQNLFDLAKQEKEVDVAEIIMSIGTENIHSNNEFAIAVFDRIIEEFPKDNYKVASAHFWKIQCFELLQMFDKAFLECEEVLKYSQFENLTNQVKKKKEAILVKLNS